MLSITVTGVSGGFGMSNGQLVQLACTFNSILQQFWEHV